MVQVQSSWFPLYDRNPQTFVESIFWARPDEYRRAVDGIHHAPGRARRIGPPREGAGSVCTVEEEGRHSAAPVGEDGIVIVDDQFAPLADKIRAALAGLGI